MVSGSKCIYINMKLSTFLDIIDHERELKLSKLLVENQKKFLDKDGDIDHRIFAILTYFSVNIDYLDVVSEMKQLPFHYMFKFGYNKDRDLNFNKEDWSVWSAKAYLTGLSKGENSE